MKPDLAVVEKVGAMPKQGVSSTFKFGAAYGSILGILAALKIRTILVSPTVWKGHFALGADKEKARHWPCGLSPKHPSISPERGTMAAPRRRFWLSTAVGC
jgi:crossover junction endodeoxyribonuclease RuvC